VLLTYGSFTESVEGSALRQGVAKLVARDHLFVLVVPRVHLDHLSFNARKAVVKIAAEEDAVMRQHVCAHIQGQQPLCQLMKLLISLLDFPLMRRQMRRHEAH
jgi:hypothetical protein